MSYRDDCTIPLLSGSVPGVLDKSQSSRLLRTPTCNLFFATFDPHVARPAASGPGFATSMHRKRIVIEVDPENGTCSWRFVPRAETEGEVSDGECSWPRVVTVCGQLVYMTQDQWDIYKLDPDYDCILRELPNVTTITRVSHKQPQMTQDCDSPITPRMTPDSFDDCSSSKQQQGGYSTDPDKMVIDKTPVFMFIPCTREPSEHTPNMKKRRHVPDRSGSTLASNTERPQPKPHGKRAGSLHRSFHFRPGNREPNEASPPQPKRSRTRSPSSVKREIEQKCLDRERKRKATMEARLQARRHTLNEMFWKNIGVIPLNEDLTSHGLGGGNLCTGDGVGYDEDTERLARIEESRRKLSELEKDRPLWERSAQRRQQQEAEEELSRQQEKEMRQEKEQLQEPMISVLKQAEERWTRELQQCEREACLREQRRRMLVPEPRNLFQWNPRLALDRYMKSAMEFDSIKFTAAEQPMNFACVPWPVLLASFSVDDIDWNAVEAFFGEVQSFIPPADFRELVEKSHRRFHPDRWKSRRLLPSVRDQTERDILEVTGSTVAQALTPLWKEVTGRNEA